SRKLQRRSGACFRLKKVTFTLRHLQVLHPFCLDQLDRYRAFRSGFWRVLQLQRNFIAARAQRRGWQFKLNLAHLRGQSGLRSIVIRQIKNKRGHDGREVCKAILYPGGNRGSCGGIKMAWHVEVEPCGSAGAEISPDPLVVAAVNAQARVVVNKLAMDDGE